MSLLVGFDPEQVEDYPDRTLIPAGKYRVMLTEVVENTSRNGNEFVRWTWIVVYGKHEDKVFETVHFPYASDNAMNAFNRFTKSLCRALKLASVRSHDDLLNKPCIADVEINRYKDKSGNQQETNRIKFFEPDRAPTAAKRQAPPQRKAPPPPPPEPADYGAAPGEDFDDDMPF